MNKEQLICIITGLGFIVDYDRWKEKGWIRFEHPISNKVEFCLIIYKDHSLNEQMFRTSEILLKLGQYKKLQQLQSYA